MENHPAAVTFNGLIYKRNPDAEQRANRVYYSAPRGSGRDLLHRDVWRHHHGCDIPDGLHIHHVDFDPFNNDPANLVALTHDEHMAAHAEEFADQRREHAERIRPLTKAWHASEEGRAWHRQHAVDVAAARPVLGPRPCDHCATEYTYQDPDSRFCSERCHTGYWNKRAAEEHTYEEQLACAVCGGAFWRNIHKQRPETCSRSCGQRARRQRARAS